MTKDNVRDLMNQCMADGNIFLIAIAEDMGRNGCSLTLWDNIRDAGIEGGEAEFLDDIATGFVQQGRWPEDIV